MLQQAISYRKERVEDDKMKAILFCTKLYHFSRRITAKLPLAKGKEASTSNDKEVHEDTDNDKKTS